eukprot:scaffold1009_cov188-Alexandrium_tamarense.AAC.17
MQILYNTFHLGGERFMSRLSYSIGLVEMKSIDGDRHAKPKQGAQRILCRTDIVKAPVLWRICPRLRRFVAHVDRCSSPVG